VGGGQDLNYIIGSADKARQCVPCSKLIKAYSGVVSAVRIGPEPARKYVA